MVPHEKTQSPRPRRQASCCRAALLDLVPGRVVPGSQGTSPSGCTPADSENSGGAPSLAKATSRHPGTGELSSSPWAVVIRGTSGSRHQAGKCGRKEGEKKEDGGLGEKGGGAHRAGNAGPNLAVSYFRTVPWDLRPEILGGRESGCAKAPNPCLLRKPSAAPG